MSTPDPPLKTIAVELLAESVIVTVGLVAPVTVVVPVSNVGRVLNPTDLEVLSHTSTLVEPERVAELISRLLARRVVAESDIPVSLPEPSWMVFNEADIAALSEVFRSP